MEFVLFGISFLLVLFSSYFFTCTLKSRRVENTVIYLILIFISQIIGSIEFLSLLKFITVTGVLGVNILSFVGGYIYWKEKGRSEIDFSEIKGIRDRFVYAIKRDKVLFILFCFFIFSSLVSLFLALVVPTINFDSITYHIGRIPMWIQNKSLLHYETPDLRHSVFPVNSEILIMWSMLFLKRDYFAILLQFSAYLGCIFLIYSYLNYFKISARRILWTIFIFASIPAVIVESSSTQTNLFVGFLLFCSLYLFIYGIRENSKKALIFSAIAFAIDMGIKYTVFFIAPVFGIVFLLIAVKEKKKKWFKPLTIFISAVIPSFLILSSYNYILNFIDYGNFFGAQPYVDGSTIHIDIKAFIANVIRYFMLQFDFSGIKAAAVFSEIFSNTVKTLFSFLSLESSVGLYKTQGEWGLNVLINERNSKYGLIGFLLFLPLVLRSVFYFITGKVISFNLRRFYINITGLFFVGFVIVMSARIGFNVWNGRYILASAVLGFTILSLNYKRKNDFLKIGIAMIMAFSYIVCPLFNEAKLLFQVIPLLFKYDFNLFRQEVRFRMEEYFTETDEYLRLLVQALKQTAPDNSKIGLITSSNTPLLSFLEANPSWKLYLIRYEKLVKRKNYNDYDFLVITDLLQQEDVIDYKDAEFNYYVEDSGRVVSYIPGERPVSMYTDVNGKFITSGQAVEEYNYINLNKIPENFELCWNKNIAVGPNPLVPEKIIRSFIYRKTFD